METYVDFLQANLNNLFIENPNDLNANVHLSLNGLEIFSVTSKRRQWVSVSDCFEEPILTMYFSIEGICMGEDKHHASLTSLQANHHILSFSPYFEGNYSIRGQRISSFGISMTEPFFRRLMVDDLGCLERFWNKVTRNEEVDISPAPLPITPQQAAIIQELKHCAYRGKMRQLFYESKVAELFLAQALQAESIATTKIRPLSAFEKERLYMAKDYIESNVLNPVSMRNICQVIGLNDFKLKKGFKALFGVTVFEYLSSLRMQYAHQLLTDTSSSVFEVAYSLGYSEPYNFTKAFKKHFGYLPSKLKL